MKTSIVTIIILIVTMLFPLASTAGKTLSDTDSTNDAAISKAKVLVMRLDVLNATDQSGFTKTEKTLLRREARSIRGDLKDLQRRRYIPATVITMVLLISVAAFHASE